MCQQMKWCFFLLSAFLAMGCDIPASERCGTGDKFVWNPETHKCTLQETDTLDAGDEPDSGFPEGLGEPCREPDDCEDFAANHCNATDLRPNGYCTVKDCEPGGCPETYQCCDCTGPGFGISCVKDLDAPAAENLMGCACD